MATLPGEFIPVVRPQFQVRDGAVYFLISKRAVTALEPGESEVWQALGGGASVSELAARFPDTAERAIGRFLDLGVCALVAPASSFPSGRKRVVVFEPHIDDGVLSIGGTMWARRMECEFLLVTVSGRSNFTSYYYMDREFFNVEEVSRLRRAEADLFVKCLGGRHVTLDESEAPLRYRDGNWTLDWFRRHRHSVSAFIAHRSGPEELASWTKSVRGLLDRVEADEIWMPLGVGPHTDHELCRNACLSALIAEPRNVQGRVIRLYQEAPYASQFPGYTDRLLAALRAAGAVLAREVSPITSAFDDKLRLVSHFGSQFKLEALRPGIEASARGAATEPGGMAELFYRMEKLPKQLDTLALYVDEALVRDMAQALASWLARHRDARRVRIVMRVPAGRWREDMDLLLAALPLAHFEAHVSEWGLAEAQDYRSTRITVHPIAEGGKALGLRALALAVQPPAPTLLLLGKDRVRHARAFKALWPLSDTLIAPSMNHLTQALQASRKSSPPNSQIRG